MADSVEPNIAGLEIVTDTVANVTDSFSLATKNSCLVVTLATRFLYDLDFNYIVKQLS